MYPCIYIDIQSIFVYYVSMYIDIVPNRKSPPAILLRESIRAGKQRYRKRTLANLSALSMQQVESIQSCSQGEKLVALEERFEIVTSAHHGHVEAVRAAMKRLSFDELLASRPCRERYLAVGMITRPASSIPRASWPPHVGGTRRRFPRILGVSDADEDDLYDAMDWLLQRQGHIEKKLAARHLKEGGMALYDLSSSYFEGTTCPLAALGHSRDGKKGHASSELRIAH